LDVDEYHICKLVNTSLFSRLEIILSYVNPLDDVFREVLSMFFDINALPRCASVGAFEEKKLLNQS